MPDLRWHFHRAHNRYRLTRLARRNNFDPAEALTIFSDPRGGSTWITELVTQIPGTAVAWEPLHVQLTPGIEEIGFQWRQHIPEDATWDEAEALFERILRGRVLGRHTGQTRYIPSFTRAEQLLVKFCRGTALLPWFVRTFAPRYAPLYFLRHPFAVAASQLKFGAWDQHSTTFHVPEGRYTEVYTRHADFLGTLSSRAETLVALWCITNGVPLHHPANNERWITVTYERLLLDPEPTLQRVFDRWGIPMPEAALDRVREASATTKDATFEQSLDAQLAKWRTQFSDDEIGRLTRILDYFEIDLYTADPIPTASF